MEPLIDKLARQKVVKGFFAAIQGLDKGSDQWALSVSVPERAMLALMFGGGFLFLLMVMSFGWIALFLPVVFLFLLNQIILLPNFCLIYGMKQKRHYKLLHFGIFLAYGIPMCLAGWSALSLYSVPANLHFLYLMFVSQRLPSGWAWNVAKFALSFLVMTVICANVWNNVVQENLYNSSDDELAPFDFFDPGDWVDDSDGSRPIVTVNHITHNSQSMNDPDTIKKGWTVADLWLIWFSLVAVSLITSIVLAWTPRLPKRLKDDLPTPALHSP